MYIHENMKPKTYTRAELKPMTLEILAIFFNYESIGYASAMFLIQSQCAP